MIADRDVGHALANRLDHAATLVARNDREGALLEASQSGKHLVEEDGSETVAVPQSRKRASSPESETDWILPAQQVRVGVAEA